MRFGFRLARAQAILKLSFWDRTLAMYIAPSFTQKMLFSVVEWPAVSSRAHFDTQI